MSIETIQRHQNIIGERQASGLDSASSAKGTYEGEAVKAVDETSPITDAALRRSDIAALPRANLRTLVQRVRKQASIPTSTLGQVLTSIGDLDNTILPQVFEFLGGLAVLLGEDADTDVEELEESQNNGKWRRMNDEGEGYSDGGFFDTEDDDERENQFEETIYQSLGVFNNAADKATAVAIARGYFEAKDANPQFLNALNSVSRQFYLMDQDAPLAQLVAVEQSKLAAATLETSPATVRLRYRKKLRENSNLGSLFEELAELGLETAFLSLFTEIGADLAATGQQSDKGYLRALTVELKKLWQLKSVHEETKDLIRITEPHLSKTDPRPGPIKLTASLLHYCAKATVTLENAQSLLAPLARCSMESQLVFANALRDLHGRMPDGIWHSSSERLLQYSALGELCFRLTETEERLYEDSQKNK